MRLLERYMDLQASAKRTAMMDRVLNHAWVNQNEKIKLFQEIVREGELYAQRRSKTPAGPREMFKGSLHEFKNMIRRDDMDFAEGDDWEDDEEEYETGVLGIFERDKKFAEYDALRVKWAEED
jgi:hypothetical protein